jgi:hypothetical protein
MNWVLMYCLVSVHFPTPPKPAGQDFWKKKILKKKKKFGIFWGTFWGNFFRENADEIGKNWQKSTKNRPKI